MKEPKSTLEKSLVTCFESAMEAKDILEFGFKNLKFFQCLDWITRECTRKKMKSTNILSFDNLMEMNKEMMERQKLLVSDAIGRAMQNGSSS